jgi:hypothetical protein
MDDQLKVAQLFHKHVGLDSVGFRGWSYSTQLALLASLKKLHQDTIKVPTDIPLQNGDQLRHCYSCGTWTKVTGWNEYIQPWDWTGCTTHNTKSQGGMNIFNLETEQAVQHTKLMILHLVVWHDEVACSIL